MKIRYWIDFFLKFVNLKKEKKRYLYGRVKFYILIINNVSLLNRK